MPQPAAEKAAKERTLIDYEIKDGVAYLTLSDPPANTYTHEMMRQLDAAILKARFDEQVHVIVLTGLGEKFFCAGANIRMLAGATHAHKVNFCKFTNETRNGIEDASEASGLPTICVINGTAAGGGYELALAADHIMLVDDGSSAVSLPELRRAAATYAGHFGFEYVMHVGSLATDCPTRGVIAAIEDRMHNDAETERKVLRNEIAKLNRSRLERMLGPEGGYDNWA